MNHLTIDQTAKLMNIGRATVYRYIRAGKLEAYKIGRNTRIRPEAIDAYCEAHRMQPYGEK